LSGEELPDETPAETPANGAAGDAGLVDWEFALGTTGGARDILQKISEAAATELPDIVARVKQAVQQRDAHDLHFWSHKLKGALRPFGAERPYQVAVQLMRKGEQHDLEGVEALFQQLEPDVHRVTEMLQDYARGEGPE
jgi:HPt (histidine-containing phosphotransfer) domain-containing protein